MTKDQVSPKPRQGAEVPYTSFPKCSPGTGLWMTLTVTWFSNKVYFARDLVCISI